MCVCMRVCVYVCVCICVCVSVCTSDIMRRVPGGEEQRVARVQGGAGRGGSPHHPCASAPMRLSTQYKYMFVCTTWCVYLSAFIIITCMTVFVCLYVSACVFVCVCLCLYVCNYYLL